ncbi:hypothetical protein F5Y13DRAFT_190328 [Hypoxylon sp. FL1857]|nr:hypothetical protein F5Y13DRAFT_190328 [Hypoxylon sp. FL1857]
MNNLKILLGSLLAASSAISQTLPPSPTASIGCHPHGDHWHCDGPVSSTVSLTVSNTHIHDGSGTLAPSPTESTGCHPHGDHWHCDGPVSATVSPTESATGDNHSDHGQGGGSLAPSPTESVGCESHGDHWHCDGPAVTVSTSTVQSAETGGAGKVAIGNIAIIGGLLAVAGMDL